MEAAYRLYHREFGVPIRHEVYIGFDAWFGKVILVPTVFTMHQKHATIYHLLFCMIASLLLKCYSLGKAYIVFLVISRLTTLSLRYHIMQCSHVVKTILYNYLSYSKNCWNFHPLSLEGFPTVHLVSYGLNVYVNESFSGLEYVVIYYQKF